MINFKPKTFKNLSVLTFFLLLTSTLLAQQKKATIIGSIKTNQGKPAEYINILLKENNKSDVTNENGEYKIENIRQGVYTIIVSGFGIIKKTASIEITANKSNYIVDLVVEENIDQLDEILISGIKEKSYRTEISSLALKSPVALKDTPQSITYVTKRTDSGSAGFQNYRCNKKCQWYQSGIHYRRLYN